MKEASPYKCLYIIVRNAISNVAKSCGCHKNCHVFALMSVYYYNIFIQFQGDS